MTPAPIDPYTPPLLESHSLTVTITHVFEHSALTVRVPSMAISRRILHSIISPISSFIALIGPEIDYPEVDLI